MEKYQAFAPISFNSFRFVKKNIAMKIKIADLVICIRCENLKLIKALKRRFPKFLSKDKNFSLVIDVHLAQLIHFLNPDGTDNFFNKQFFQNDNCFIYSNYFTGYIEISNNYCKLICNDSDSLSWLEHFLRIAYAVAALKNGAILFHGAGLVSDGKGFVFFGPSGSGKSTVTELSHNCTVLGDDLIVIKKLNNHFKVYATPFNSDNNGFLLTNTNAAVRGLYRLIQHKTTFIKKMSRANALAELLSSISSVNKNYEGSLSALDLCTQIVNQIPCYEMYFTKDNLFWRLIYGNSKSVSH